MRKEIKITTLDGSYNTIVLEVTAEESAGIDKLIDAVEDDKEQPMLVTMAAATEVLP